MKYKKGVSGNPNGRPKGAKNKVTAALIERVEQLIANNFETLESDLRELEPRERVKAIISLLNYALPKRQSIAVPLEDGNAKLDLKFEIIDSDGNIR